MDSFFHFLFCNSNSKWNTRIENMLHYATCAVWHLFTNQGWYSKFAVLCYIWTVWWFWCWLSWTCSQMDTPEETVFLVWWACRYPTGPLSGCLHYVLQSVLWCGWRMWGPHSDGGGEDSLTGGSVELGVKLGVSCISGRWWLLYPETRNRFNHLYSCPWWVMGDEGGGGWSPWPSPPSCWHIFWTPCCQLWHSVPAGQFITAHDEALDCGVISKLDQLDGWLEMQALVSRVNGWEEDKPLWCSDTGASQLVSAG